MSEVTTELVIGAQRHAAGIVAGSAPVLGDALKALGQGISEEAPGFTGAAASAFYQVVNLRYEKQHSTIVTTNRGLPDWGEIFGDTVVAAAILDRARRQLAGL